MYLILLCFLLSGLSENDANMTDIPSNIVVMESETVTMRCSIDTSEGHSFVRWFRDDFNRENKVFTGNQINKRLFPNYDINRTVPGQYDLIINSVNTSHAGTYICQEEHHNESSAELVVIGTEPRCEIVNSIASNSEDLVTARCIISFKGNLPSVMECNRGDIHGSISTGIASNRSDPIINLTSTLILPIRSNHIPNITCTVKFTDPNPFSSNANNVPEHVRVWNVPLSRTSSDSTTPMNIPYKTYQTESIGSGKVDSTVKSLIAVSSCITVLSMIVIAIALVLWKVKTQGTCYESQKQLPDPDVITIDSTPTNRSNRDTGSQSDFSDIDAVYYNDQIGNLVALNLPPNKIGDDGTEYVQMNFEATNRPQIVAKPKLAKPVPSSADVYAAIDHTMVLPSRGNKKPRK